MKRIFVYGTLLSGFGNWRYHLKDKSEFLGVDSISGNYTMVSLGGFPGVVMKGNSTIRGEVYLVSDNVYKSIEMLEGYHENPDIAFYSKAKVNTKYGEAEMYILPEKYLDMYDIVESGNWREV